MVFKIVCSYCGKDMGTKEAPGNGVSESLQALGLSNISHSICSICFEKEMANIHSKSKEDENDELA